MIYILLTLQPEKGLETRSTFSIRKMAAWPIDKCVSWVKLYPYKGKTASSSQFNFPYYQTNNQLPIISTRKCYS